MPVLGVQSVCVQLSINRLVHGSCQAVALILLRKCCAANSTSSPRCPQQMQNCVSNRAQPSMLPKVEVELSAVNLLFAKVQQLNTLGIV